MASYTSDALVLRVKEQGASDKLFTLLSAEGGRFYALQKGAHSTKRREAAATELFTYSNFEFYERDKRKWIKSATALHTFGGLRFDAEKLFLAAYFAEVAGELTDEQSPPGEMLPLLLNTLHHLSAVNGENDRIKAAFEMRTAAISGFCPDLTSCAHCGAAVGEGMYLDVMNGALICPQCLRKQSAMGELPPVNDLGERRLLYPLSASAVRALSFVVTAPPKRFLAFRLTDAHSLHQCARAAEAYLLHHLERGFSSLENYKKMRFEAPLTLSKKVDKNEDVCK